MENVTGIFSSVADAKRALPQLQSVVSKDKITVLFPGHAAQSAESVELTSTEQPGVGKAIGGVAGAAVGMAGGIEVGAAAMATAILPGVGPVIGFGLLGGALLGYLGAKVGQVIDRAANREGLPEDEFFVYEDALRRGRSVVIATCDDESTAKSVREILRQQGAEAVDVAREMWWIGLRSAEQEHYTDSNEKFFRMGFEAALHAKYRCREYDQVLSEMQADLEEVQKRYPGVDVEKPFVRGFDRGRGYYEGLCKRQQPKDTAA